MVSNIKSTIGLFFCYVKMTTKAWFQYKLDACIRTLTVFLRESTNVLIIYFMLQKFDNINGWDRNQLFFLYSLLYVTYGILIIFCTGLRDFDQLIVNGQFDRFLLRPQGALFQVIASNSDWFAAIGHGGLGITLFIFTANKLGIVWNLKNILYYVITIISGTFIQISLFLIFASLSFYIMKSSNLRELLYWQVRKFAGYPISIFNTVTQIFLMGVIPFAFVNFFPAEYLLRNDDMNNYPTFFIYFSPLVAIIMSLISYAFWRISLRHYSSTGS